MTQATLISSSSDERRRHPSCLNTGHVRFANESERIFSRLLDLYQVSWVYEPFEFPIAWDSSGLVRRAFRPDFWLPNERCFIELTTADQRLVTRKNAKIRAFRNLYPEWKISVVYQRDYRQLVERHGIAS